MSRSLEARVRDAPESECVVEGEDLKTNLLWRNVRGHKLLRTVRAHAHNGLVAGSLPAEPASAPETNSLRTLWSGLKKRRVPRFSRQTRALSASAPSRASMRHAKPSCILTTRRPRK